jgi:protein-S-isoprenylcysteine O-methyltransferase Ste14
MILAKDVKEGVGLMVTIRLVTFLLGTACLVYISWSSLAAPGSHGFYRFFAWEAILGLVALNMHRWIHEPFSWHQLISWPLLLISAYLVIDAVRLLRKMGEQDKDRDDVPLVGIERTTRLITEGSYRYIRHPLYSSLLSLAGGIFFKAPSGLGLLLLLAAVLFLFATARVEEEENLRYFGEQYRAYMRQTKMFIPFLF